MALLRGILKKQYRFCLRFSKGTKHLIIVWTPTLLFSSAVDKRWCYYTWELYIWILWTRTHAYVGRFLLIWSGIWDEKTIWRKCVWFSWFLWRQMGGKMAVVQLTNDDARSFISDQSADQLQKLDVNTKLRNTFVVQFRRGTRMIQVKNMKMTSVTSNPWRKTSNLKSLVHSGRVLAGKKADIIKKLCPPTPIMDEFGRE